MSDQPLKIVSASRRVEMPGFYPDKLTDFLIRRLPPEKVHTLVLWSKRPENILSHSRLSSQLKKYDQIILHYTITGMGASRLEPNIPDTGSALKLIPDLAAFLKNPERLIIRFDPIIHLLLPDGSSYTNLNLLPRVLQSCRKNHIQNVRVSWLSLYDKVIRRLRNHSIEPSAPDQAMWKKESGWVLEQGKRFGVNIEGCCVPGWPVSRCIDASQFIRLHPQKKAVRVEPAGGQRPDCGCHKSWDIGWYYTCPGGCLYCYANPADAASGETLRRAPRHCH